MNHKNFTPRRSVHEGRYRMMREMSALSSGQLLRLLMSEMDAKNEAYDYIISRNLTKDFNDFRG